MPLPTNGPMLSPSGMSLESPSAVPSMAQTESQMEAPSLSWVRIHFMVEKIHSSGVASMMVPSLYNKIGYQGTICKSVFGDILLIVVLPQ